MYEIIIMCQWLRPESSDYLLIRFHPSRTQIKFGLHTGAGPWIEIFDLKIHCNGRPQNDVSFSALVLQEQRLKEKHQSTSSQGEQNFEWLSSE